MLLNVRYYVQASFLITTLDSDVPATYVQHAIIRGGNFWSMGLRTLYLATTLLMWIFGPIPMFSCSVLMVIVLQCSTATPCRCTSTSLHSGNGATRGLSRPHRQGSPPALKIQSSVTQSCHL